MEVKIQEYIMHVPYPIKETYFEPIYHRGQYMPI